MPTPEEIAAKAASDANAAPKLEPGEVPNPVGRAITEADVTNVGGLAGDANADDVVAGLMGANPDGSPKEKPASVDEPTKPPEAPKPAEPTKTDPPKPEKKEYTLGKKKFGSAEELAAYVKGVEETQVAATAALAKPAETPKQKFEDVVFEDPAKARQILEDEIMAKIEARDEANRRAQSATTATERRWTEFYNAHPDLKGFENDVRAEINPLIEEKGEGFSLDQAMPILADRARAKLKLAAERFSPAKELASKSAVVGASAPADSPPPPAAPKAVTFIDQVRAAKQRGKIA